MLDKRLLRELRRIVGKENVLYKESDLLVYEYDASLDTGRPEVVVFPTSTEQVAAVVKLANRESIPFVPRGSGTNLSGGSVALEGGIVVELSKMREILEIDVENQRAVVEPGVYNLDLQNALGEKGYLYAPDPASQKVSTMGGNVAENAGGPHCLKYGVTTNHVLGLEIVLPDGEVIQTGGECLDLPGYDLTGLFVGSEGTFGIVTKIVVRIMRKPEAVKTLLAIYDSIDDASSSVSAIIANRIIPATLEMMDKTFIYAVEESLKCGYPLDAEAVLIIELDGLEDEMERLSDRIVAICKEHNVRDVRTAQTEQERDMLWQGRRGAFGAIARLTPSYMVMDGTVPRTKLPQLLKKVAEVSEKFGLRIGNVFHAGDGNLHPLILFDSRKKEETEKVLKAGHEILEECARVGGTISGEHGIGIEKRDALHLICGKDDVATMMSVKNAFDPKGLCNPGKIFPQAAAS